MPKFVNRMKDIDRVDFNPTLMCKVNFVIEVFINEQQQAASQSFQMCKKIVKQV